MRVKHPKKADEKESKTGHAHRKKIKFPSGRIVSLNLAKCVNHNLTDLRAKLEISRNHRREVLTEQQGQEIVPFTTFCDRSITCTSLNFISKENNTNEKNLNKIIPKMISEMKGKKFKSLGKRFIMDFRHFSKFGDRSFPGNTISYSKTLRWFRKAELLDNHRITIRDIEVHFINKLKSGNELKILEFIQFLKSLCEDRGLEMSTVIFRLLNCRNQMKATCNKKLLDQHKNFAQEQELKSMYEKKEVKINMYGTESKVKAHLENAPGFKDITFKEASTDVPKAKENKSIEEINKVMSHPLCNSINILSLNKNIDCINSTLESDSLCYIPEMNEMSLEEKCTVIPKKQNFSIYSECLKISDKRKGIERKAPLEKTLICVSEVCLKESKWIIPVLRSIPPLDDGVKTEGAKKSVRFHFEKKSQKNINTQNSKLLKDKRIKLMSKQIRNDPTTSIKFDVIKTENQEKRLLDGDLGYAYETFSADNEEGSYTYIPPEVSSNHGENKLDTGDQHHKPNRHFETKENNAEMKAFKVTKVSGKIDKSIEAYSKARNEGKGKMISINHSNRKIKSEKDKNNEGNFEISHNRENKTLKKVTRTMFNSPSKKTDSSKIKSSFTEEKINGDFQVKREENLEDTEIENIEASLKCKKATHMHKFSNNSEKVKVWLLKSKHVANTSSSQNKQSSRKLCNQEATNIESKYSDNKNTSLKLVPLNKKRSRIKNNRTFTNLTVQHVQKSLQKARKLKVNNCVPKTDNLTCDTNSKTIGSSNKMKISPQEQITSTSYNKLEANPTSNQIPQNQVENEGNNLNTDPSTCASEMEKTNSGRTGGKLAKVHKIRKGVRLRKKELKDPQTEIQNQDVKPPEKNLNTFVSL